MKSVSIVALALASSLHSWSRSTPWPTLVDPSLRPSPEIHDFPLSESQEWFVKPSYLIMIPNIDNVNYGNKVQVSDDYQVRAFKVEEPSASWGSGVRIGIGRYLPHHDLWDFSVTTTYIYNDSNSEQHVRPSTSPLAILNQNPVIDLGWDPLIAQQAIRAQTQILLNYFTWDLSLRRQFTLSPNVTIEPFIGLRFPLIYQKYRVRPTGAFYQELSEETLVEKVSFTIRDHFYGGGPRIGYDLSYLFLQQWRFLGQLAVSFIYSNQSIHEEGKGYLNDFATLLFTPGRIKYHQSITALRTNLEVKLGLGWETWVRNQTVRIAPSFVFEMSQWFDYIHWSQLADARTFYGAIEYEMKPEERTGDFGLMGFAVNLQIDF